MYDLEIKHEAVDFILDVGHEVEFTLRVRNGERLNEVLKKDIHKCGAVNVFPGKFL